MSSPLRNESVPASDAAYLQSITAKIAVCRAYQPKFGQGESVSFEEFQALYGGDQFYSWFGLDHPLMYAAHKAAGGITSLYRQIGIGCEQLFRRILQDHLELTEEQANWSYTIPVRGKKARRLSLDGRIHLDDLKPGARARVVKWLDAAAHQMDMARGVHAALQGAVFEVRQGYKSKDSKRQNADIGNAGKALTKGYLPVVAVLSTQIDSDIADRYRGAGWLLLTGGASTSATHSVYAFCKEVVGYDLAAFFERNRDALKATVDSVLRALLSPEAPPESTATGEADELEVAEETEA
jgi:hypothetical protein